MDDYEAIQVSIPTAWNEVSGEPWDDGNDLIGSSIIAAADIDGFFNTYNEPGVFFGMIFLRIVAALPEVQLLYWQRNHSSTNFVFSNGHGTNINGC